MDSSVQTQVDPAAAAAGFAAMGVVLLVYLAVVVFLIACHWRIYSKAGKPGWAAIVPFYNLIVLCEMVGKPAWFWLLLLIPIVNIYPAIVLTHGISRSFGKDAGYTVGLLLLGIVFFPMLAFGSATYVGPAYARSSSAVG